MLQYIFIVNSRYLVEERKKEINVATYIVCHQNVLFRIQISLENAEVALWFNNKSQCIASALLQDLAYHIEQFFCTIMGTLFLKKYSILFIYYICIFFLYLIVNYNNHTHKNNSIHGKQRYIVKSFFFFFSSLLRRNYLPDIIPQTLVLLMKSNFKLNKKKDH